MEYLSIAINKDTYGESRFSAALSEKRGAKIVELLNSACADVEKVMQENSEVLEKLAVALVEKRELSNREILKIIEGR
jgi:ATP-dependent Zn protease